jgi:hypothetical protein
MACTTVLASIFVSASFQFYITILATPYGCWLSFAIYKSIFSFTSAQVIVDPVHAGSINARLKLFTFVDFR